MKKYERGRCTYGLTPKKELATRFADKGKAYTYRARVEGVMSIWFDVRLLGGA